MKQFHSASFNNNNNDNSNSENDDDYNLFNNERYLRLVSVKNGIYNSMLPTLRKYDRDDALCKLSDEHSRSNLVYKCKLMKVLYF
jgi:hypothetical protein